MLRQAAVDTPLDAQASSSLRCSPGRPGKQLWTIPWMLKQAEGTSLSRTTNSLTMLKQTRQARSAITRAHLQLCLDAQDSR